MDKKNFQVILANTTRQLLKEANDMRLTKEDIVTITQLNGQLMLIYYK